MGFLMIDNRAAPKTDCMPRYFESETIACAQCRALLVKNPLRTRERARCSKCGYLCDNCAVLHKIRNDCRPHSQIVDEWRVATGQTHG